MKTARKYAEAGPGSISAGGHLDTNPGGQARSLIAAFFTSYIHASFRVTSSVFGARDGFAEGLSRANLTHFAYAILKTFRLRLRLAHAQSKHVDQRLALVL